MNVYLERSIITGYKLYNLILFITLKASESKPREFTFLPYYYKSNNYEYFLITVARHCIYLFLM